SLALGDFTAGVGTLLTNYVLPTTASGPGHITPANASISVTAYTSANTSYNCNAHMATGTATGCHGHLAGLNLSGTSHPNAGDYPSDAWTFNAGNTNTNYNSVSSTVHDSIAKAHLTVMADDKTKIFDTAVYSPFTATITGFLCGDTVA